ncbi:hypothetical protein LJR090_003049 [Bosea sp. LjRoot90]|uniref:hypothetical protein n=1 Tax=Bosea sp. LjRoot90 TaxID=3342342 RepID=UPI003ECD67F5
MRTIALTIMLTLAPAMAGLAQDSDQKVQQPAARAVPVGPEQNEADRCKPQPTCRLLISPLVPSAPGGGLKAQGRGIDDEKYRNWADRGPLDPRSFRLPAEIHT